MTLLQLNCTITFFSLFDCQNMFVIIPFKYPPKSIILFLIKSRSQSSVSAYKTTFPRTGFIDIIKALLSISVWVQKSWKSSSIVKLTSSSVIRYIFERTVCLFSGIMVTSIKNPGIPDCMIVWICKFVISSNDLNE